MTLNDENEVFHATNEHDSCEIEKYMRKKKC